VAGQRCVDPGDSLLDGDHGVGHGQREGLVGVDADLGPWVGTSGATGDEGPFQPGRALGGGRPVAVACISERRGTSSSRGPVGTSRPPGAV
jgi:hypothetical protein